MQDGERLIFQDVPDGIDETWQHGALVGGMASLYFDAITLADAYKLAGDTLVDRGLTSSLSGELIYPILDCYRHSVRLYLKAVADPPTRGPAAARDVVVEIEAYLRKQGQVQLPAWLQRIVAEFDDFDKDKTAFRFPGPDIRSANTGETGEFWIDLRSLQALMDRVQAYFRERVRHVGPR